MGHDHDHGDHDHEHEHDEEEGEIDIVTLVDAEGNEVEFAMIAIVEHDGSDYALLVPAEQYESDDEDSAMDVFVYSYSVDEEGNEEFEAVEDPEVLKAVEAAARSELDGFEE